jgi:hypothetical protein
MYTIQKPEIKIDDMHTRIKLTILVTGIKPTPLVKRDEINAIKAIGIKTILKKSPDENSSILLIRHI